MEIGKKKLGETRKKSKKQWAILVFKKKKLISEKFLGKRERQKRNDDVDDEGGWG